MYKNTKHGLDNVLNCIDNESSNKWKWNLDRAFFSAEVSEPLVQYFLGSMQTQNCIHTLP